MEYAPNGTLFYFIHNREGIDEKLALRFIFQLAKAIQYLHQRNIVHRDIKPENILLDEKFNIKLCDFGWACKIRQHELRTSICGTEEYMSPEIFTKRMHNKSVDIWCLGILLYELLMGVPPFSGDDLKNKIVNKRIMIKNDISPEVKDLLKGLLKRDSKKRYNIDEVLNHKAF